MIKPAKLRALVMLWLRPHRLVVAILAILLDMLVIGLLTLAIEPDTHIAWLLLGYQLDSPANYPFRCPFTVQDLMHLLLFIGLGEVYCRWRTAAGERALLDQQLLPEAKSRLPRHS